MTDTRASFTYELVASATLFAGMVAVNIVWKKPDLTLTFIGQVFYALSFVVIAVSWRRFSAALAREDLAASCLAGITFALVFVYVIDTMVGGTFVRVSLYRHYWHGAPYPPSEPLMSIFHESILLWLICGAACIIWRLRRVARAHQTP